MEAELKPGAEQKQTGIFALPELSQSMTLNLMVSWGKKEPLFRGSITLFQK